MDAQAFIDRFAPGSRVTDCRPLPGGVSAEVHAVDFIRSDGRAERVVIRRHRDLAFKPDRAGRAAREYALLSVLHARGLPVPRTRLFVAPDTLVIDLMPGTTALPPDPAPSLAAALAAIHATDPAGLPDLPLLEDPLPALRDWLTDVSGLDAAFARTALPGPAPRLLHGDFWPGNVLWSEGKLSAVLDWEDAAFGDPLSDLACARVELACAVDDALAERFTHSYLALTGGDAIRLPLWDLYVATAALTHMNDWGLTAEALAARRARTTTWQARALAALGLG